MKQILFLSGKGGTGKTTLAAAFAALSTDQVLADCDVDAANLHLVLDVEIEARGDYIGSKEALRDAARCTQCGICVDVCRFRAISPDIQIDPYLCEGCGACVTACPEDAIALEPRVSGQWFNARTPWGPLASAELLPGEETTGLLVTEVKRNMVSLGEETAAQQAILDGSPGIGCPVIASVTGVDVAVLVTEPSVSGLHDLKRIHGVVKHFGIPAYLVINKADLSPELTQRVEAYASDAELPILGTIPFDRTVSDTLASGRSVVESGDSTAGNAIRKIYQRFMEDSNAH